MAAMVMETPFHKILMLFLLSLMMVLTDARSASLAL